MLCCGLYIYFFKMFFNKFCFMFKNFVVRVFTMKNIRKIFIIFFVGLCFRVGIHFFLGVNVFVDFLNAISLAYYGFMSCFVVSLEEFLNVPSEGDFRIKSNNEALNVFFDKNDTHVTKGRYIRRPPAGVRGLYEKPNYVDNPIINSNLDRSVRVKARICWITWKHFMTGHSSYQNFLGSLDNDFSTKKEFKKDIKRIFKIK